MTETKAYLREQYGKCKKQKMYVDTKTGETKHIGYIYCFKNKYDKILEQHWLSFYDRQEIDLSI